MVRTIGDAVLRTKASPVIVDEKIRLLADEMTAAMFAFDGIGLAAPQVGEALRLVVLGVPQESSSQEPSQGESVLLPRMPFVLVNPEIVSSSEDMDVRDEGCLSVPDFFAPVSRPRKVTLRTETLDGEMLILECGGLLGRCVQHELDHLDGILFTDRLRPEDRERTDSKLRRVLTLEARRNCRRTAAR